MVESTESFAVIFKTVGYVSEQRHVIWFLETEQSKQQPHQVLFHSSKPGNLTARKNLFLDREQ
jgi:hypothetical protein